MTAHCAKDMHVTCCCSLWALIRSMPCTWLPCCCIISLHCAAVLKPVCAGMLITILSVLAAGGLASGLRGWYALQLQHPNGQQCHCDCCKI